MPKILECDSYGALRYRCLFYSHNPYLICSVHPSGVESDNCIDFRENLSAEVEEQWQPEGASYYNGELILQPPPLTTEQQLEILDTHPIFTGFYPQFCL